MQIVVFVQEEFVTLCYTSRKSTIFLLYLQFPWCILSKVASNISCLCTYTNCCLRMHHKICIETREPMIVCSLSSWNYQTYDMLDCCILSLVEMPQILCTLAPICGHLSKKAMSNSRVFPRFACNISLDLYY